MAKNNARITGFEAEDRAVEYLLKKDYKLVERNYRQKQGEVDIIMIDGNYLVFVEVKMRATTDYGYPREYVHWSKQQKIQKTAQIFMNEWKNDSLQPRFDVIEIIGKEGKITHLENVF